MRSVILALGILAAIPMTSAAQKPAPARPQQAPLQVRGWIDVNGINMSSSQDAQDYAITFVRFREVASATTAYPALPSAAGVGLDAGAQFHRRFGVGVHFDFTTYDSIVGLGVRIPHPTLFNRFATDVSETATPLERRERAIDISAMAIVPTSDKWRIRVFGGPTYFKLTQEMVSTINYDQVFSGLGFNSVDISTFTDDEVEGSTWGFHGGVDVGYFFSRHVGVGGVLRVNRGTLQIDEEPFTLEETELSVGHVTVGGGLRLRF